MGWFSRPPKAEHGWGDWKVLIKDNNVHIELTIDNGGPMGTVILDPAAALKFGQAVISVAEKAIIS